ncbi:MAG: RHS repeat domain-containing protein, partial [Pirellula sp.]
NKNKTSETIGGTMSGYGFTSAGTSYDDEDRLTGFARTSGTFTQSWNLTKVGDWTSVTTNGTAQNRTHGPTHELLTAGGQNISTDVKGNITVLPANLTPQNSALGLQWDFDNKLRSADLGNNSSVDVNFQYDALGRRVARTGTGGSVVYVQHDQQTIADYPVGGVASTPTYRYVYASYIDEPVVRKAAGTSGAIHYYHRNQQYSITAMTTSTGAVAERYAYTAYGQPTILNASGTVLTSSAVGNRYTYTGREWDATLGLHHFRARWMSPLAGRFLGRDPIGLFAGPSSYRHFRNSPVARLDPSGLIVLPSVWPGENWDKPFYLEVDWFLNIYNSSLGCTASHYKKGCIGIVQDVLGKVNLAENTECYSFAGDVAKTMLVAKSEMTKKKCEKCSFPMMFAVNFHTNGKGVNACQTCGRVQDNPLIFPPLPPPDSSGTTFDFCVRLSDDEWLGANHGASGAGEKPPFNPMRVIVWPSVEIFSQRDPKQLDTLMICVTCTGKDYIHDGLLGIFPHQGPCTERQLNELHVPPFFHPEPW